MTDEMTGPADASKNAQNVAPQSAHEPEPVILEEIIIKKVPQQPAPQKAAPAAPVPASAAPATPPHPTPFPATPQPAARPAPQSQPPANVPPMPSVQPPAPPAVPAMPSAPAASPKATEDVARAVSLIEPGMPRLVKIADNEKRTFNFASLPPIFKQPPKMTPQAAAAEPANAPVMPAPKPPAPTPAPPHEPPAVPPPPVPPKEPTPPAPPIPTIPKPAPPPDAPRPVTASAAQPPHEAMSAVLKGVRIPERVAVKPEGESRAPKPAAHDPLQAAIAANVSGSSGAPLAKKQEGNAANDIVTPVHTLRDDLQHVVQEQKISVVRAVSLESERRAHEPAREQVATPPAPHRRLFRIVFAIILLLVLGGAALLGVYYVASQSQSAPPAAVTNSLLFAEQSVGLPLQGTPTDLKQLIANARQKGGAPLGSITRLVPIVAVQNPDGTQSQRPATLAEFLQAIGANPPADLLRALSNDFFFGIHTVDKNAPLLVIPVTQYDRAFAGMLAWENTMNTDLAPAFTAVPSITHDQNGLPEQRTFSDLVMRNYDVRALRDDAGQIELYYSFPSQNMLVIAESPYSFTEIIDRLQAARQL